MSHPRLESLADLFLTPRPTEPTPRDLELAAEGTPLHLRAGLAGWSWGKAEATSTVLFVHGWESRATHWGAFISAFVEAGFRAIAIDAPAHGLSPGVQTNGLEYARKLIEVGDELGPFQGVVAHSFGTAALTVALQRGLNADRAVMIAGPSSLRSFIDDWGPRKGLTEAEIPAFIAIIDERIGEPTESFDIPKIAATLDIPALIVHDRDDLEIPVEQSVKVAEAWPGSTYLLTEKLGHRRILISRKIVQAVVDFVQASSSV